MEKNYNKYDFTLFEKIIFTGIYIGITSIYSLLFYDSFLPVILSLIFIKIYFKYLREYLINRQKEKLLTEFKEWLFSINSSLTSGYALENAIKESLSELEIIYGRKSFIYEEIYLMINKMNLNISLEKIFENFALRSGLNDIEIFSQIIIIAKKNGGNMISVIKNASESIGEEISLKAQINTAVSSSRYELYIMALFPLVIIKYIDMTQPGFFMPLYHNFSGLIIMSICLAIYFSSLLLANKILKFTRRF